MRDAIEMSSYILDRDPTQLAAQLVGRLKSVVKKTEQPAVWERRILDLLESATEMARGQGDGSSFSFALVPEHGCLQSPGNKHKLQLFEPNCASFAVTPDSKTLITASTDVVKVVYFFFVFQELGRHRSLC